MYQNFAILLHNDKRFVNIRHVPENLFWNSESEYDCMLYVYRQCKVGDGNYYT